MNSGAPLPAGWRWSRPSACCWLTPALIAAAMRPSRLRASARSSFWNRSSPASEPPLMVDSPSSRTRPLSSRPSCTRAGSNGSVCATSLLTDVPSTSFWPPPAKTPIEPSVAAMVVTCRYLPSSAIALSRWSSRSLGAWPMPIEDTMDWFRSAIRRASSFTALTATFTSWTTPACCEAICSPALRMRSARSSARASTTCRADASCGLLETSTKALKSCPAA